jgi:predicted ATP-grasp superfamily ATP-dependent carboligase
MVIHSLLLSTRSRRKLIRSMTIPSTSIDAHVAAGDASVSALVRSRAGKRFTKVLLLDAYSTRTLACVRSWGKRGIAFAVGGETRWDMSLFSRYAREQFVYRSPKQDLSQFIRDVNHYSHEFAADGVLPTSEAAIMALSQYRNELACIPIVPGEQEIQTAFSKANTLNIAQSLGITVPKTLLVTDSNLPAIKALALNFPVAVKSESSEVMLQNRTHTSKKTAVVCSKGEMEKECRLRLATDRCVVVQEFIDGYGVGVSGLFDEGRPVALIGHRRLRESTPWGGPSALAETIEIDSNLLHATTALMRRIGFTGPAMAEYKIDRRSGQPYLMEINGRFWGSVLLAIAAGQDLPYLYWKMLNGIEVQPEEKIYRVGVRGRYLVGDTKSLMLSLRGRPKGWRGQVTKRGSAIKSYVSSFFDRQTAELILTSDDPMPFLGRLMQPRS